MATHPLVSVFSGVPSAPALTARRLTEAGIPLFPCGAGGKRPLPGSSGFHDATTNPSQVADWWGRFPDANVAILGGTVTGQKSLTLTNAGPYVLATAEPIAAGATQVYTLVLDAKLSLAVLSGATNLTECLQVAGQ